MKVPAAMQVLTSLTAPQLTNGSTKMPPTIQNNHIISPNGVVRSGRPLSNLRASARERKSSPSSVTSSPPISALTTPSVSPSPSLLASYTPPPAQPPPLNPFHRVVWSLNNDPRWLHEITLGRRVGFYRFRGDLGNGNFSHVKLGLHQLTKEKVAIKILDKTRLDQKTQRMLTREIAAMESLHHPNLIRLFEVVETLTKIHLVMEFASGGELFAKITSEGRLTEDNARPLFAQVVAAIHHMHSKNIIHRDIKAENVFFAGPTWVKVGDFGFSTSVEFPDQLLSTFCGSPPYAAPELFRDESYCGAPVDMWALGVLLFFMVTGGMPFKAQRVAALKQQILEGSFMVPPIVTPPCADLVRALLRPAPPDRPKTAQVMSMQWVSAQRFPRAGEEVILEPYLRSDEEVEEVPLEPEPEHVTEVRSVLGDLGISGLMLREHLPRGARSAVVGTFRIVTHRLRRRGSFERDFEEAEAKEAAEASAAAAHAAALACKRSSFRRRTRRAGASAKSMLKSKTCVLL